MEDIARKACLVVGKAVRAKKSWKGTNGVRFLSIRGLYIPRNGQDTFMLPHWTGLMAIMTPIIFVIMARTVTHHLHTSARHYLLSLHHSCVLLFYDHAITILTILTTHIFSYLSLTLPGLSLDLHSFDYSFLSRLCPLLTQPAPLFL